MADVAMQSDNSELTFYALEFMAKWIAQGENAGPPVFLSVDEGLVIAALGTAGRTYNSRLLDGSWAVLKRSLRQKKAPSPESYLAKICAHANLGNLPKAFSTLHEFETAHGNSNWENGQDLFSPFHSLNPLVVACTKNGFTTLDSVSSLSNHLIELITSKNGKAPIFLQDAHVPSFISRLVGVHNTAITISFI